MGWTFLYNAPEKRHVIEDVTRGSQDLKCIKQSCNGNHLWTIWERTDTKKRFIALFLLQKSEGNWGYKDITEDMGPCYYDCPLYFLDEVTKENSLAYNENWRARVRKHHGSRKERSQLFKNIEVGSLVKLKDSKPSEFRVLSKDPFRGVSTENGMTYKLVKSRIIEVT
jgi:hypothetical protein